MASSAASVARGSLILVLGGALAAPINLVALAFLARTLAPQEMGALFAFDTIAHLFALASDPGLSTTVTTYSAEGIGRGRNVSGLIRRVISIGVVLSSVVAFAVLVAGAALFEITLGIRVSAELLLILCAYVFLISLAPYVSGPLIGFEDFKFMKLAYATSVAVGQTAAVGLVLAGFGVFGVLLGWALGSLMCLIVGVFALLRDLGKCSSLPPFAPTYRELVKFSLPLCASDIVEYGSKWFDRILVLAALPIEKLAVYSMAYSIYSTASGLPAAVSEALLPHFAKSYGRHGMSLLKAESEDAARYVAVIFTPLFMGLAAVSGAAISLFAGPGYSDGAVVLAILCVFGAIALPRSGFTSVFSVVKETRVYVVAAMAASIGGVLTGLILSTPFDIVGIAVARGIALFAAYAVELWSLKVILSARLRASSMVRILSCGAIMAIAVFGVERIAHGVQFLGVYLVTGILAYALLVRQMRLLRKRDFDVTRELLAHRFGRLVDFIEKAVLPAR